MLNPMLSVDPLRNAQVSYFRTPAFISSNQQIGFRKLNGLSLLRNVLVFLSGLFKDRQHRLLLRFCIPLHAALRCRD
jgi:hypothetical protein